MYLCGLIDGQGLINTFYYDTFYNQPLEVAPDTYKGKYYGRNN